jgi:PTH2 family peptidyl-tRNA hydrolase
MSEPKLRIFMNSNAKMSRGKYAAHAVHAALTFYGVHPGTPVVVLGAKPRDIEQMTTFIRDEGRTELLPGTITAGTDGVSSDEETS